MTNRIVPTLLVVTTFAVVLALAGCKSREEQLIDRRHELRETLDDVYESYSGDTKGPGADSGVVGRLVAGIDRAHFDEYCLAIGRGERPFAISRKLEDFMKDRSHARACRRAAEIQVDVEELEREVSPRR
jgi:hypothetical protein